MKIVNRNEDESYIVDLELDKNEIGVRINGTLYSERDPDSEISANKLLLTLVKKMDLEGFEFQCCLTCEHFRFSGMSMQMSNGRSGYCGLIGFRSPKAIVVIDHYCKTFSKIE